MKYLILTVVFASIAQTSYAEQSRVQERKVKMIANLDKRISILQEAKECISNAGDKEGVKSCRETSRSKMKAFKSERKRMNKK